MMGYRRNVTDRLGQIREQIHDSITCASSQNGCRMPLDSRAAATQKLSAARFGLTVVNLHTHLLQNLSACDDLTELPRAAVREGTASFGCM